MSFTGVAYACGPSPSLQHKVYVHHAVWWQQHHEVTWHEARFKPSSAKKSGADGGAISFGQLLHLYSPWRSSIAIITFQSLHTWGLSYYVELLPWRFTVHVRCCHRSTFVAFDDEVVNFLGKCWGIFTIAVRMQNELSFCSLFALSYLKRDPSTQTKRTLRNLSCTTPRLFSVILLFAWKFYSLRLLKPFWDQDWVFFDPFKCFFLPISKRHLFW